LPPVQLNRFDLFHAHLFLEHETGEIGLLFHAQEYPAFSEEDFPYCLGFCQEGSSVTYCPERMSQRNVLWWDGHLHALDLSPARPLHHLLLDPVHGGDIFFTLDEALFGTRVLDVCYFQSLHTYRPEHRLFVA